MKRKINKVKIFIAGGKVSYEILVTLKEELLKNDFEIVEENPDLAIAIGGDGSFLRMVKELKYNSNIIYVGINSGTLGFLQEIKVEDIDMFIASLKSNNYNLENISIQETEIITDVITDKYFSLNEIVIREKDLNTAVLNVSVNNNNLERFVGDGLLIATSVGSTAYNLSLGGSIVCSSLHTLQITPIAPLNNKAYRNLLNSLIVPENTVIELIPSKTKCSLLLSIDGENKIYNNVQKIRTMVLKKRIKCLRLNSYNFFDKVNDKFLTS